MSSCHFPYVMQFFSRHVFHQCLILLQVLLPPILPCLIHLQLCLCCRSSSSHILRLTWYTQICYIFHSLSSARFAIFLFCTCTGSSFASSYITLSLNFILFQASISRRWPHPASNTQGVSIAVSRGLSTFFHLLRLTALAAFCKRTASTNGATIF